MHLDGGSLHVDVVVTIIMMLTIHCNIRNISVMSGDILGKHVLDFSTDS